ncbi:FGGY-family carbohydrate kinase [Eubacterium sp. AB3007]|uniref:xylulokinase n=1 Tax=Eubacterium sp. AB3007 TaxID=1392487 RepID=UPI000480634D|nr:FGGY-family carbohydrate kinase [Eubacterium sp. AB3007]
MKKIENYLLGMDCGTTNIKAVILGEDGVVVCEASRPNKFINPGPGMQEQDAHMWWKNASSIIREITEKAGEAIVKRIRGISVSSHTVSLLPLDEQGEPLRNAMTYQDGRSSVELEELVDTIGRDRFVEIIGGQPSIAFLPAKLYWYKKHEPELFARTDCLLQCSSYINYKLTGEKTSDIDQASRTQCMDRTTNKWSREIGDAMGIDLDSILPPPRPVDDIIGFVTNEAAEQTGLLAGIPVIAGCSDAMASMYATGMSRLGEAGEASGTTSLVFVGSTEASAPDVPVVTRPCGIDGVPWIFDAPIQASGASLKWFIETMAAEERAYAEEHGENIFAYLNELALEAPAGCRGLYFFPYLLGERAPLWNDHAKGMFIGMGMDTSRAELTRSIFEGTAFALRHVMETIRESGGTARTIRVCGGGAKSRTWNMIKASMLKMPVYILADDSGDVPVGDCMIVGKKVGVFKSFEEASSRAIRVKEIIQPVDEWVEVYDKLYPYYVKMYQHLDQDLKELKQTVATL